MLCKSNMKLKEESDRLSPDIPYFNEDDDLCDLKLKELDGLLKYPEMESGKKEQSWYNSSLEKELNVEEVWEKELFPDSVFYVISEQGGFINVGSSALEELNGKQTYVSVDTEKNKENMHIILKQKQIVKNGLIKHKEKPLNQNQNYNLPINDKYTSEHNPVEEKENWKLVSENVLSERQQIKRSFHIHNRKEECEICNESDMLEEDESFSRPRKMLLSCEVCNKEFSTKLLLDGHECSHTEEKQTKKTVNFSQRTEIPLRIENDIKKDLNQKDIAGNDTKKAINQEDIVFVANFSQRFKIPLNIEF